jgi:hypothetical protein
MPKSRNDALWFVLKVLALAFGVFLFISLFRGVDTEKVFSLVASIGLPIGLVLLPYLFTSAFDSYGWKVVVETIGQRVDFLRLLAIRLGTESLLMSLPGGAVFAEAAKPFLLRKFFAIPASEGTASIAVKKGVLGIAHGFYLFTSAALGFAILQHASPEIIGRTGLGWLGWIFAAVVFLVFSGITALFLFGGIAQKVFGVLMKIPIQKLRDVLLREEESFHKTDAAMVSFRTASKSNIAFSILMFYIGWLFEAVDTWLIFYLLGAPLSIPEALALEATLSLLRSILFMFPAGIGVQDAGYVLFLRAFGIANAETLGVAFVVIKRCKEIFWILVGYIILGTSGVKKNELESATEGK